MDAKERQIRLRLKEDFEHYANKCLRIRTKSGAVGPFALNGSQKYVHERLEEQKRRAGRVRALVLKARQWGCSTYVEGRFYWRVTHRYGVRAFILTHMQDATDNLFDMVRRYHEYCPDLVKPNTGASSAKELFFDRLDSGYKVATAGSKAVGRSDTIQLFHGSEAAHWPNASEHMAGAMQAVPKAEGTEIILESTANGIGGMFYDMCIAAEAGDSEYELIFVPWFWHEEYTTEDKDWSPPGGWAEYGDIHSIPPERLKWAYEKNSELAKACGSSLDQPCWLFKQEYPATVQEAFQAGGEDSLISHERVFAARNNTLPDNHESPLVLGVDVARGGGDKTRMIDRCGRRAGYILNRVVDSADLMQIAGMVAQEIERLKPERVFVDSTGGYGSSVCDRLKEMGYGRVVVPVEFGGRPIDHADYLNKRAEMWGRMRDWFTEEGGVDLVADDELHRHIVAPTYSFDSSGRLKLEPKEKIKERLGFSPDGGDALCLTFAHPIPSKENRRRPMTQAQSSYNPLSW